MYILQVFFGIYMYILYGRRKVHFRLNTHVHSSRILENIHVFLSKGLRYREVLLLRFEKT